MAEKAIVYIKSKGVTTTFLNGDGDTVTVIGGIITNIS